MASPQALSPARVTLTVHVTAEPARLPELTEGLVNALHALSRDDLAVTVDEPTPRLVALPGGEPAPLRVLADARRVLWRGREVSLTRLEFDLLLYLATHANRVHRRRALMTQVWRTTYVSERTVDVHVRRLRGKIDSTVELIRTVRGVGYQFADPGVVSVERG